MPLDNSWTVYLSQNWISWIRAMGTQNKSSFDHYYKVIENIRKMASSMNDLNFIACGEGFKVYVKEESTILGCAYFAKEKQIHIIGIS